MVDTKPIALSPDVHWVGVNDVETRRFEGLWDIPEGVSYNSYLVVGSEKTVLVDSVNERSSEEHFVKIGELTDFGNIDYIIINHMEQDHTSGVPALLKKAPQAKVIFTPIAQTIFKQFYRIDPPAMVVKGDDQTISLGNKTLRFIQTPWLHWPETMSTFLAEEKILFSCDAFGSFRNLPEGALKESEAGSLEQHLWESKKYFASVFNGQREWVIKAIEKFKQMNLEIEFLAPSHGPVYTTNSAEVIETWASWSREGYSKTVVVVYGSMYGMTAKCLNAISEGVKEAGGTTITFNLSEAFPDDILSALVEAPALIVGSPTYEHEIFPKVKDFLDLLKTKKFSNRFAGVFGSFGWSGEATRKLTAELTNLGFEIVGEPLSVYGSPKKEDLEKAKLLGKAVAEKAFFK